MYIYVILLFLLYIYFSIQYNIYYCACLYWQFFQFLVCVCIVLSLRITFQALAKRVSTLYSFTGGNNKYTGIATVILYQHTGIPPAYQHTSYQHTTIESHDRNGIVYFMVKHVVDVSSSSVITVLYLIMSKLNA